MWSSSTTLQGQFEDAHEEEDEANFLQLWDNVKFKGMNKTIVPLTNPFEDAPEEAAEHCNMETDIIPPQQQEPAESQLDDGRRIFFSQLENDATSTRQQSGTVWLENEVEPSQPGSSTSPLANEEAQHESQINDGRGFFSQLENDATRTRQRFGIDWLDDELEPSQLDNCETALSPKPVNYADSPTTREETTDVSTTEACSPLLEHHRNQNLHLLLPRPHDVMHMNRPKEPCVNGSTRDQTTTCADHTIRMNNITRNITSECQKKSYNSAKDLKDNPAIMDIDLPRKPLASEKNQGSSCSNVPDFTETDSKKRDDEVRDTATKKIRKALLALTRKNLPSHIQPILRRCEPQPSSPTATTRIRKTSSIYKGVHRTGFLFSSTISFKKIQYNLGLYESEWDAARMYAWARQIIRGPPPGSKLPSPSSQSQPSSSSRTSPGMLVTTTTTMGDNLGDRPLTQLGLLKLIPLHTQQWASTTTTETAMSSSQLAFSGQTLVPLIPRPSSSTDAPAGAVDMTMKRTAGKILELDNSSSLSQPREAVNSIIKQSTNQKNEQSHSADIHHGHQEQDDLAILEWAADNLLMKLDEPKTSTRKRKKMENSLSDSSNKSNEETVVEDNDNKIPIPTGSSSSIISNQPLKEKCETIGRNQFVPNKKPSSTNVQSQPSLQSYWLTNRLAKLSKLQHPSPLLISNQTHAQPQNVEPLPLHPPIPRNTTSPVLIPVGSTSTNYCYSNHLRPTDILMGRGSFCNAYPGNVWFRDTVSRYRTIYMQLPKFEKLQLARNLVNYVRLRGGRFLEPSVSFCPSSDIQASSSSLPSTVRSPPSQNNPSGDSFGDVSSNGTNRIGMWFEAGDKRALAKTSQALRDGKSAGSDRIQQTRTETISREDSNGKNVSGSCPKPMVESLLRKRKLPTRSHNIRGSEDDSSLSSWNTSKRKREMSTASNKIENDADSPMPRKKR